MKNFVIVLVLVALPQVHSSIYLSVLSPQNDTAAVKYLGLNVRQIKESDLALFKLSMPKLRDAVKNYFNAEPDHLYLAENVPFGDLHQDYCWEPVSIVASVLNATVKNVSTEPETLATQDFQNDRNETITVKTSLTKTIENTIKTTWTVNKEIAVRMEVEYEVGFIFYNSEGYAGFTASLDWGKTEEKIQTETAGTTSEVEMQLKPGQKVTAVLVAQKGTIKVEVEYAATLRGILGVSFSEPHNGHYYWGVPIDQVLDDNDIDNYVNTAGSIDLGYYTSIHTKVFDGIQSNLIVLQV